MNPSLYDLLPAVYRLRDLDLADDSGHGPLRTLLGVIDADLANVERALARLYDDWFIETCDDDRIAAIGELVGVDPTLLTGKRELDRKLVANALSLNARKGTAASLAVLAASVAPWPTRVSEAFQQLATHQPVRFTGVPQHRTPDVRNAPSQTSVDAMRANRLSDVRAVDSRRTRGRGRPTSVLLDAWRAAPDTVVRAPAHQVGPGWYVIDPLGRDLPLAIKPSRKRSSTRTVGDVDVPQPLTRARLAHHLADFVGVDRSVMVWVDDEPVALDDVVVGNLASWHPPDRAPWSEPGRRLVCLDPELGRVALRPANGACWAGDDATVEVGSTHLRSHRLGSGHRSVPPPVRTASRIRVGAGVPHRTVASAYDAWASQRAAGKGAAAVTIVLLDDTVHVEPLTVALHPGESLSLVAASGAEPTLTGGLHCQGRTELRDAAVPERTAPRLRLVGVRLWAAPLVVTGAIGEVEIDRCTLGSPPDPSVLVESTSANVAVRRSLIGPLRIGPPDDTPPEPADPVTFRVEDSVIDAGFDGPHGERVLRGWRRRPPEAVLTLVRSTVLGSLDVVAVDEVLDSLVTGPLRCTERQHGVVRHSYLGSGSRTPRQVHCQPDDAVALAAEARPPVAERAVTTRLLPSFDSRRIEAAGYARLTRDAPFELRTGAHDGGEVGAHHDEHGTRRADLLGRHLSRLAPAGGDIDVRFET